MNSRRQRCRTLTPRERGRIRELRAKVPTLGLRQIARAFKVSVRQVTNAIGEVINHRHRTPRKCPVCGAMVITTPCLRCELKRRQKRPGVQ